MKDNGTVIPENGKLEHINDRFRLMMTKLHRRIPDELVKQRREGGKELDYIEWTTAADIGDDVVGRWQNYVKDVRVVGDLLIIISGIKIKDPETGEWLSRENVGIEYLSRTDSVGDAASNAFAMSYKRTWVLWGPGRELYKAPDYTMHRVATDEQINTIKGYLDAGLLDDKVASAVSRLLAFGELTMVQAARIIRHVKEKLDAEMNEALNEAMPETKNEAVAKEEAPAPGAENAQTSEETKPKRRKRSGSKSKKAVKPETGDN